MIKRIIDKETKIFSRDDFTFDEETEIGLEVEPAQGLYVPRWNGEAWEEDGTPPEPTPPEPTAEERLAGLERAMLDVMGGMFQ